MASGTSGISMAAVTTDTAAVRALITPGDEVASVPDVPDLHHVRGAAGQDEGAEHPKYFV